MKTIYLIYLFLFFALSCSNAQNNETNTSNFFFKTELDSLDVSYGKSLMQSQWDTLPKKIVIQDGRSKIVSFDSIIVDTIHTDYLILKNIENISAISEYIDTNKIKVLVSNESERIMFLNNLGNNYINVTTNELFKEGHQNWIHKGNKIVSGKWELKFSPPIYKKEQKTMLYLLPGTTRTEIIPAQYKNIIAVYPKKDIKASQLKSIHSLCNQYYLIIDTIQYTIEKSILDVKEINSKIILLEKASIALKEIHKSNNINLISKIQKQLFFLGFYKGNFLGELTKEIKEAIINYQIKNNLPIGQLDMDTVNHILKRKTPFNGN